MQSRVNIRLHVACFICPHASGCASQSGYAFGALPRGLGTTVPAATAAASSRRAVVGMRQRSQRFSPRAQKRAQRRTKWVHVHFCIWGCGTQSALMYSRSYPVTPAVPGTPYGSVNPNNIWLLCLRGEVPSVRPTGAALGTRAEPTTPTRVVTKVHMSRQTGASDDRYQQRVRYRTARCKVRAIGVSIGR